MLFFTVTCFCRLGFSHCRNIYPFVTFTRASNLIDRYSLLYLINLVFVLYLDAAIIFIYLFIIITYSLQLIIYFSGHAYQDFY